MISQALKNFARNKIGDVLKEVTLEARKPQSPFCMTYITLIMSI